MLTTYFTRPATHVAYYAGPAGPYLDPFTDWLAKRGYGYDAIRHLLLGAAGFGNWVQAAGSSLKSLSVRFRSGLDMQTSKQPKSICGRPDREARCDECSRTALPQKGTVPGSGQTDCLAAGDFNMLSDRSRYARLHRAPTLATLRIPELCISADMH